MTFDYNNAFVSHQYRKVDGEVERRLVLALHDAELRAQLLAVLEAIVCTKGKAARIEALHRLVEKW